MTHKPTCATSLIWGILILQLATIGFLVVTRVADSKLRGQFRESVALHEKQRQDYEARVEAYEKSVAEYAKRQAQHDARMQEYGRQKHSVAVVFDKLGNLFLSGVPFLEAVVTVQSECPDETVAKALGDIHSRVSERQNVDDILSEYGDTFPRSVQLLWKVSQKHPEQLADCCLRIAGILKSELMK